MPPNRLSPRKTRRWLVYRGFPSTMLLLIKQEGIGNTNNTLQYQLVRNYSGITAMTGRRPLEKRSHLHCSGPCKWTDTSINPKAARPQNKLAVSLRDRPPLHFGTNGRSAPSYAQAQTVAPADSRWPASFFFNGCG